MNAEAMNIDLTAPRLRSLCLAIAIALATMPCASLAQDAPAPPATAPPAATQAQGASAEEAGAKAEDEEESAKEAQSAGGELFSVEDSDDPERLKELTQIRSSVEFGLFYVSDDSFKFGRYTGLVDQGPELLLNLDIFKRGDWDSDDAGYWSLQAADLGLDSRRAEFEVGVQGKYAVTVDYSEIPNYRSDSVSTIYDGAGSDELTLPSDWVGSANTAGMTRLLSSQQSFDLETQRRRAGVGLRGVLGRNWDFSTSFRRETKEGTRSIGAVFGNSGGNPRAVLLPEPVDYTTDQFEATLRYTTRKWQLDATYHVSLFSDDNDSLTWENPFTTIGGWSAGTGFPSGVGRLSTPPDNSFRQLAINGAYNFSDHTRISAGFEWGRMRQDDNFLPYTNIPLQAASITQPLPRDSLDGRIDTTLVTLNIASRPTDWFSWNASYRYDDRDNETPRSEYVYIGGDSQLQNTAVNSSFRRYNSPYSYRNEEFKLDGSFRLWGDFNLSVGAQDSEIDRTYLEREQADEDSYWIGLRGNLADQFDLHMLYTDSRRDGSTYVGIGPFLDSYSPGYTSTVVAGWENHPQLRRFFEADRKRDQFTGMVDWSASQSFTLSAEVNYSFDDYDSSEVGLVDSKNLSATVDAVYAPSQDWSLYAFQTYEQLNANQAGHSFAGGANQIPQSSDPRREWFVHHGDRIDTTGFGYKRLFGSGRGEFGIDYLRSKTSSELDFEVGSLLTTRPLPDNETRLESINVHATWKLQDRWSLRAGYWFEHYDSSDWALDGIEPNQLANVILLGEDSPSYRVHVVTFSMIYRF